MPAFEDPVYFLRREGQLPINVDPADSKLKDAEERDAAAARLRTRAERAGGLSCCRLQRGSIRRPAWESGLWMLRGKHLVLIPGDSPIGLRLPVAKPAVGSGRRVSVPACAATPWRASRALPVPQRFQSRRSSRWRAGRESGHAAGRVSLRERHARDRRVGALGRADGAVRRAARRATARLLPPLTTIEDYLELVAAIEDTAAALEMPVVVEGETAAA